MLQPKKRPRPPVGPLPDNLDKDGVRVSNASATENTETTDEKADNETSWQFGSVIFGNLHGHHGSVMFLASQVGEIAQLANSAERLDANAVPKGGMCAYLSGTSLQHGE